VPQRPRLGVAGAVAPPSAAAASDAEVAPATATADRARYYA
jgi:hypothetical protein